MKKLLALLLAIATLFVLVACGNVSTDDGGNNTGDNTVDNTGDSIKPEEKIEVTIAESVLYEENGVRLTVKGLDGNKVKMLLENDTEKNIAVSGDTFVINGVTMGGNLYIQAAAGKKTNDSFELYSSDLEIANISTIAKIQTVDAHIVDTDSYETIADIQFEILSSVADSYTQKIDESGEVLYDEAGITVIAKGLSNELFGPEYCFLIKNNTDSNICASVDNVSVNGFTVSTLHSHTVCAGTVRFSGVTLSASDLEENEIAFEDIKELALTIKFMEDETYNTITTTDELHITVG